MDLKNNRQISNSNLGDFMRLGFFFLLTSLLSLNALADSFPVEIFEGDNAQKFSLNSSVVRETDFCDVYGTCIPSYITDYKTKASVNFKIEQKPELNLLGEMVTVELFGNDLRVTSDPKSEIVFLAKEERTSQVTRMLRNYAVNLSLIPRKVEDVKSIINYKNLIIRDGILSFVTEKDGIHGSTRLKVTRRYQVRFDATIDSEIKSEPFGTLLRHTVNLRSAGIELKGDMLFEVTRNAGMADSHGLAQTQVVNYSH